MHPYYRPSDGHNHGATEDVTLRDFTIQGDGGANSGGIMGNDSEARILYNVTAVPFRTAVKDNNQRKLAPAAPIEEIYRRIQGDKMKITGLETIVIENARMFSGGPRWLFIQLTTDEGIVGLGERPTAFSTNIAPLISLFHGLAEEFLIGANPFDIEKLWQRIYASRHDFRHPSLFHTPALSAIEIAC